MYLIFASISSLSRLLCTVAYPPFSALGTKPQTQVLHRVGKHSTTESQPSLFRGGKVIWVHGFTSAGSLASGLTQGRNIMAARECGRCFPPHGGQEAEHNRGRAQGQETLQRHVLVNSFLQPIPPPPKFPLSPKIVPSGRDQLFNT